MTVTIQIKDDRIDDFYRIVEEHDLREDASRNVVLDSHIDEALRREQDPILSQARPWIEARQRYVGKGL